MQKGLLFTKWIHLFSKEEVVRLDILGLNATQIANKLGIPERRFGEMLRHFNIKLKSKRCLLAKNFSFFDEIDSEIKAYLLGYLIADGCIAVEPKKRDGVIYSYNNRVAFTSSIDDKSVLSLFIKYVCPNNKMTMIHNTKGAKNRKYQLALKFSNKYMVDTLITKYKIIPRKTYDTSFQFPFETIPTNLRRHFIRGFFDGDGWVIPQKIKAIGFVGTSYKFLEQIGTEIKNTLPDAAFRFCKPEVGKTVECFRIIIKSPRLYQYLYQDSNFFLKRKEKKFHK